MYLISEKGYTGKQPIPVGVPGAIDKFRAWIERGDLVLVFQNHDLGHPELGHLIFMPTDKLNARGAGLPEDWWRTRLGNRMPDTSSRIGWRYLLVAITDEIDRFVYQED